MSSNKIKKMKTKAIAFFILFYGLVNAQEMLPNVELKTLSNSTISTQKIASRTLSDIYNINSFINCVFD